MSIKLPPPPDIANHKLVDDDDTMTRVYGQWFQNIYTILTEAQTGAPGSAQYVIAFADALLPNAQVLNGLSTGFAKITAGEFTTQATINSSDLSNSGVAQGTYGSPHFLLTVNPQGQITKIITNSDTMAYTYFGGL